MELHIITNMYAYAAEDGQLRYPLEAFLFLPSFCLVIPPAETRPYVNCATRFSFDGDIKSVNSMSSMRDVPTAWELLGLSKSVVSTMREAEGVRVITSTKEPEWDRYYYGVPDDSWLRRMLACILWNDGIEISKKAGHRCAEVDLTPVWKGEKPKHVPPENREVALAAAGVGLAVPTGLRVRIEEGLALRKELRESLAPFWRTVQRLNGELAISDPKGEGISQQVIEDFIREKLGTSLSAWSTEIENDISHKAGLQISKIRKWGKTLLTLVSGVLKRDIEKVVGTLFEIPSSSPEPSSIECLDFDRTIKILHRIRSKIDQNYLTESTS